MPRIRSLSDTYKRDNARPVSINLTVPSERRGSILWASVSFPREAPSTVEPNIQHVSDRIGRDSLGGMFLPQTNVCSRERTRVSPRAILGDRGVAERTLLNTMTNLFIEPQPKHSLMYCTTGSALKFPNRSALGWLVLRATPSLQIPFRPSTFLSPRLPEKLIPGRAFSR
jgi:hypothetical protein